ncbi:hypothetical protein GWK47_009409 [Chionoecetes opilio]|uniref:Uncharacterized protein n=1 Tax=Chionoecetes opilio TaxID=41210 RepID=A0A8J4XWZ4_CHIOP|nr:hypothetical protein GWK47_009409 [Chionoecetes opilio]
MFVESLMARVIPQTSASLEKPGVLPRRDITNGWVFSAANWTCHRPSQAVCHQVDGWCIYHVRSHPLWCWCGTRCSRQHRQTHREALEEVIEVNVPQVGPRTDPVCNGSLPGMWLTSPIHHPPSDSGAVQVALEQRQPVSREAELFKLCQEAPWCQHSQRPRAVPGKHQRWAASVQGVLP